jgi:hypothetical protein
VCGTRCNSGPSEGAPCTENQTGTTYADPGGCKSLVCDGKEFGPVLVSSGDPCNDQGLICSPQDGTTDCPGTALVCDGTTFAFQGGVGPGAACNQAGVVCQWPGTECDTCTCDGTTFQCQEKGCLNDAGGPPSNVCPGPAQVVAGQSCNGQLTCPSNTPCEGGASGACACVSGTWACQCVVAPVALASGENAAQLAIDATNVYWTNYQDGLVRKIAIGGGSPQTIASGQAGPTTIAVDTTSVYWTDHATTDIGSVMKVPLGGGTPVVLASNQQMPYGIAVDTTNVYWAAYETLMAVPLGGGTPATLVTAQQPIYAFTIDSTELYWSSYGTLSKVALTGGTPVSLAAVQTAAGIAVDATSLYWTDAYGNAVTKAPLAGGATTSLATGQDGPSAIAVDSTNVYWIDYSGGTVMKVAKAGGAPVILAIGQSAPGNIAVDAVNVYWTGGGNVMMTPK